MDAIHWIIEKSELIRTNDSCLYDILSKSLLTCLIKWFDGLKMMIRPWLLLRSGMKSKHDHLYRVQCQFPKLATIWFGNGKLPIISSGHFGQSALRAECPEAPSSFLVSFGQHVKWKDWKTGALSLSLSLLKSLTREYWWVSRVHERCSIRASGKRFLPHQFDALFQT